MYIGLYFGSFNPIHNGHLAIAEYMYQNYPFDAICFVVSPSNPLKNNVIFLSEHKRLELLQIAIEDKEYFFVSDIEFAMERPSYTYLTLRKIQSDFPQHSYSLILGSDNMDEFSHWKHHEEILENYTVYVYPRGRKTKIIHSENIIYTNPALLDISSTIIREKIKNGESIQHLLPPKVLQLIEIEKLYQ